MLTLYDSAQMVVTLIDNIYDILPYNMYMYIHLCTNMHINVLYQFNCIHNCIMNYILNQSTMNTLSTFVLLMK